MKTCDWLFLALLSILWGGSFFFVEVALAGFGPLTVVLCRVGIAALALNLYLAAKGQRLPSRWRDWQPLFVMGFLNNLAPFSLIAYGQLRIDSGLASILNATTPLFTVAFAQFLTRDERMTWNKLLGVGLGITGVIILIGPRTLRNLDPVSLAQFAILGAAISYAFASIYGKRLTHLPNVTAAAGMLTASTVMMLPVALVVDRPNGFEVIVSAIGAVIALALLSTAIAYVIYFRILVSAGATNLMLVTFLIPVSAITLGTAFLGERLDLTAFIGMALIFAGLAAVDGRIVGRKSG